LTWKDPRREDEIAREKGETERGHKYGKIQIEER